MGGKGYKPYTSLTGKKVSGDWEDSDRGAGNKAKKRAGGKVEKKSPTYLAHVHNKAVDEGVTAKYKGKNYKLLPGKVRAKMSGKGGLDGDYRDDVGKAKDWVTDKLGLTNTKRDGVKEAVLDERLGGKGYKPYTSMTGKKVSGDWEDSDRGAGNKAKKRAGGTVKKKSPTYQAYVLNKEEVQTEDRSIFKKAMSKVFKKKQEERKPQKAQDAGARAKRMLARKVHAKYVSGSEDNVPDDIRDTRKSCRLKQPEK